MDLQTIANGVERGAYDDDDFDPSAKRKEESAITGHRGVARFKADLELIWSNCQAFNTMGSEIWNQAGALRVGTQRFVEEWLDGPTNSAQQRVAWANAPTPSDRTDEWEKYGACDNDGRTLVCDGCAALYDWRALRPPITELKEDMWGWFCPRCSTAADARWRGVAKLNLGAFGAGSDATSSGWLALPPPMLPPPPPPAKAPRKRKSSGKRPTKPRKPRKRRAPGKEAGAKAAPPPPKRRGRPRKVLEKEEGVIDEAGEDAKSESPEPQSTNKAKASRRRRSRAERVAYTVENRPAPMLLAPDVLNVHPAIAAFVGRVVALSTAVAHTAAGDVPLLFERAAGSASANPSADADFRVVGNVHVLNTWVSGELNVMTPTLGVAAAAAGARRAQQLALRSSDGDAGGATAAASGAASSSIAPGLPECGALPRWAQPPLDGADAVLPRAQRRREQRARWLRQRAEDFAFFHEWDIVVRQKLPNRLFEQMLAHRRKQAALLGLQTPLLSPAPQSSSALTIAAAAVAAVEGDSRRSGRKRRRTPKSSSPARPPRAARSKSRASAMKPSASALSKAEFADNSGFVAPPLTPDYADSAKFKDELMANLAGNVLWVKRRFAVAVLLEQWEEKHGAVEAANAKAVKPQRGAALLRPGTLLDCNFEQLWWKASVVERDDVTIKIAYSYDGTTEVMPLKDVTGRVEPQGRHTGAIPLSGASAELISAIRSALSAITQRSVEDDLQDWSVEVKRKPDLLSFFSDANFIAPDGVRYKKLNRVFQRLMEDGVFLLPPLPDAEMRAMAAAADAEFDAAEAAKMLAKKAAAKAGGAGVSDDTAAGEEEAAAPNPKRVKSKKKSVVTAKVSKRPETKAERVKVLRTLLFRALLWELAAEHKLRDDALLLVWKEQKMLARRRAVRARREQRDAAKAIDRDAKQRDRDRLREEKALLKVTGKQKNREEKNSRRVEASANRSAAKQKAKMEAERELQEAQAEELVRVLEDLEVRAKEQEKSQLATIVRQSVMKAADVKEWNRRRSVAEQRVDDIISRAYEPSQASSTVESAASGAQLASVSPVYTALPADLFDEVMQAWLFLHSFGGEDVIGLSSTLPRLDDLEAALLSPSAPLESGVDGQGQSLRNKMLLDELHMCFTRLIGDNIGETMLQPGYNMFGLQRPLNSFTWPELLRQQLLVTARAREYPQFDLEEWKELISDAQGASVEWVKRDETEHPKPGPYAPPSAIQSMPFRVVHLDPTSHAERSALKRRLRGKRALLRLQRALAGSDSAAASMEIEEDGADESAAAALRAKVSKVLRENQAGDAAAAQLVEQITATNALWLSDNFAYSCSEDSEDPVTADFSDPTLDVRLFLKEHKKCLLGLKRTLSLTKIKKKKAEAARNLGYWKSKAPLVTANGLAALHKSASISTLGQLLAMDAYGLNEIRLMGIPGLDIGVLHQFAMMQFGTNSKYMAIATRYMNVVMRATETMHRHFTAVFKPSKFPNFVTRVQCGWSPGVLDLSKPEHLERDRVIHAKQLVEAGETNVNSSSSEDEQIDFPPTQPVFTHAFEGTLMKPSESSSLGVTIRIHKNGAVRLSGIGARGSAPDSKLLRVHDEILCVDRMRLRRGHYFEKLLRTAYFIRDKRGEVHLRMRRRQKLMPALANAGGVDEASDEDEVAEKDSASELVQISVYDCARSSEVIDARPASPKIVNEAAAGMVSASSAATVPQASASAAAAAGKSSTEPYVNIQGARWREIETSDDVAAALTEKSPPIGHGGLNYTSILSSAYTGWNSSDVDNNLDPTGSELWPKAGLGSPCPWGPRAAPLLLKEARVYGFVLNPFLGREVRLADGSVGVLLAIGLKGWTTVEIYHSHEVKKLRTSEFAIRSGFGSQVPFQSAMGIPIKALDAVKKAERDAQRAVWQPGDPDYSAYPFYASESGMMTKVEALKCYEDGSFALAIALYAADAAVFAAEDAAASIEKVLNASHMPSARYCGVYRLPASMWARNATTKEKEVLWGAQLLLRGKTALARLFDDSSVTVRSGAASTSESTSGETTVLSAEDCAGSVDGGLLVDLGVFRCEVDAALVHDIALVRYMWKARGGEEEEIDLQNRINFPSMMWWRGRSMLPSDGGDQLGYASKMSAQSVTKDASADALAPPWALAHKQPFADGFNSSVDHATILPPAVMRPSRIKQNEVKQRRQWRSLACTSDGSHDGSFAPNASDAGEDADDEDDESAPISAAELVPMSLGEVVDRCHRILKRIFAHPTVSAFTDPVDLEEYDDYLNVVDTPMDLSIIAKRLESGFYENAAHAQVQSGGAATVAASSASVMSERSADKSATTTGTRKRSSRRCGISSSVAATIAADSQAATDRSHAEATTLPAQLTHQLFARDLRVMFANCRAYNAAGSNIVRLADSLEAVFDLAYYTSLLQPLRAIAALRRMGSEYFHPTMRYSAAMLPESMLKSHVEPARRRAIVSSEASRANVCHHRGGDAFGFDVASVMDPALRSPICFGAPGSGSTRTGTGKRRIRSLAESRQPGSGDADEGTTQRTETTSRAIWSDEAFSMTRYAQMLATVEYERWSVRDRVHFLTMMCNMALETKKVRNAIDGAQREVVRRTIMSRRPEVEDEWWDYVSASEISDMIKEAREAAEKSYRAKCEKFAKASALKKVKKKPKKGGDEPTPEAADVLKPKPLPALKMRKLAVGALPCALCGQKLNCFTKFEHKRVPTFVCMDPKVATDSGLHQNVQMKYSSTMLRTLGVNVVPFDEHNAPPPGSVVSSKGDPQMVPVNWLRDACALPASGVPTFVHEGCVLRLSEMSSNWLQKAEEEKLHWKNSLCRAEFLGRSQRGALLWSVPCQVYGTQGLPVPMIMMQLAPTMTPHGMVGWVCLRAKEEVASLLVNSISKAMDGKLHASLSLLVSRMPIASRVRSDAQWERRFAGCSRGIVQNNLSSELDAEGHLRSAQSRAIGQCLAPVDTVGLGCSTTLWSLKEKAKSIVWALPPSAFKSGEWSTARRAAAMQSLDAVQEAGMTTDDLPTESAGDEGGGVEPALWGEIDERSPHGYKTEGTVAAQQARFRRKRVRALRKRKYTARSLVSRLCPGVSGAAAQVLQILMELLTSLKDSSLEEWYHPRPHEARNGIVVVDMGADNTCVAGAKRVLRSEGTVAAVALEMYKLDAALRYSQLLQTHAAGAYYFEDDPDAAMQRRERNAQLVGKEQRGMEKKIRLLAAARPSRTSAELNAFDKQLGGRSGARRKARFAKAVKFFAEAAGAGLLVEKSDAMEVEEPLLAASPHSPKQNSASYQRGEAPQSAQRSSVTCVAASPSAMFTQGGGGDLLSTIMSSAARWGATQMPKSPVFALPPSASSSADNASSESATIWKAEHMYGMKICMMHFGAQDKTWALLAASPLFEGHSMQEIRELYRSVVFPRILEVAEGESESSSSSGAADPSNDRHPVILSFIANLRGVEIAKRRKANANQKMTRTISSQFFNMASGLTGVVPSTLQGNDLLINYFFHPSRVLHPYPTKDDINSLATQAEMPIATVKNWFGACFSFSSLSVSSLLTPSSLSLSTPLSLSLSAGNTRKRVWRSWVACRSMPEAELSNELRRCAAVLLKMMDTQSSHYFFQEVSNLLLTGVAYGVSLIGAKRPRVVSLIHVFQRLREGWYAPYRMAAEEGSVKRGHEAFANDCRSVFVNAIAIAKARKRFIREKSLQFSDASSVSDGASSGASDDKVDWVTMSSFDKWNHGDLATVAKQMLQLFDSTYTAYVVNPGPQAPAGPWGDPSIIGSPVTKLRKK